MILVRRMRPEDSRPRSLFADRRARHPTTRRLVYEREVPCVAPSFLPTTSSSAEAMYFRPTSRDLCTIFVTQTRASNPQRYLHVIDAPSIVIPAVQAQRLSLHLDDSRATVALPQLLLVNSQFRPASGVISCSLYHRSHVSSLPSATSTLAFALTQALLLPLHSRFRFRSRARYLPSLAASSATRLASSFQCSPRAIQRSSKLPSAHPKLTSAYPKLPGAPLAILKLPITVRRLPNDFMAPESPQVIYEGPQGIYKALQLI
ncbi:uncharacterized protein SCHCODRAFT_02519331 [Schizophyllum commune H4-8]|nr:uncharacterized protein SCHCODRAFT_02519331 [Schizophyllum commune H4-8]KAI5886185.1 hypothetical protein SCHCODRAFT_02519331 [Schizophyllum commune H4-8]